MPRPLSALAFPLIAFCIKIDVKIGREAVASMEPFSPTQRFCNARKGTKSSYERWDVFLRSCSAENSLARPFRSIIQACSR